MQARLERALKDAAKKSELAFKAISPNKSSDLKNIAKRKTEGIYFLDLHKETAGDDWNFINHFLGLVPGKKEVPNLLIVDAVEGLEAFIGDIDTFGESRTRRSRVAQLARNCVRSYTNVVFVVERRVDTSREPEQFIADYVFALQTQRETDYSKRTIEVEKFRGNWHSRGQHEVSVRKGNGTFSGEEIHLDEPRIPWINEGTYLSHIIGIPSLHAWNRDLREEKNDLKSADGHPSFGLPLLDRLLGNPYTSDDQKAKTPDSTAPGSITFLLGDAGTHKSRLARRFLAEVSLGACAGRTQEHIKKGVAVMISTALLDKKALLEKIAHHIVQDSTSSREAILAELIKQEAINSNERRILCRRLSVRHLSSAHFLRIIERQVVWAKSRLRAQLAQERSVTADSITIDELYKSAGRIRLVIDDWNNILETHPNLASDPLIVQSLMAYLKREGISVLLVSTQPGQPFIPTSETAQFDLRKIDEQHIYTWNVSFYGERRTAMTCLRDRIGSFEPEVYELRPSDLKELRDECIVVSREFGLYSGIETGSLERVPLEVKLVGGPRMDTADTGDFEYPKQLTQTLQKVFPAAAEGKVVTFESYEDYDNFSMYADWLDDSRSGKTTILQIDEFWNVRPKTLMQMEQYWCQDHVATWKENEWRPGKEDTDAYGLWKTHPEPPPTDTSSITRRYYPPQQQRKHLTRALMTRADNQPYENIDRIPYLWDFGLLLADKELWESCATESIEYIGGVPGATGTKMTIGQIWNQLCMPDDKITDGGNSNAYVNWIMFLSACQRIAAKHPGYDAFDLDSCTTESASCALLEIWSSTAQDFDSECSETFAWLSNRGAMKNAKSGFPSLKKLLADHSISLLVSLTALTHTCSQLTGVPGRRIQRVTNSLGFVASRHWYSTACMLTAREQTANRKLCVLGLPGRSSTRGDWYLAVSEGSRSRLLAERAIDLMTSRKMNLVRLHDGLGLPVRDILPGESMREVATALHRRKRELGSDRAITLRELDEIGASGDYRNWLWRSSILNYDRDCFYLRRWITRMLFERRAWMNGAGSVPLNQLFDFAAMKILIKRKHEPRLSELIGEKIDASKLKQRLGIREGGLTIEGITEFKNLLSLLESALRE